MKLFLFLALLLAQCTPILAAGESAIYVHPSSGAITRPVTAATFKSANSIQPLDADLTLWAGLTPPASGTSGGIPYFSASTTLASSAALTANAIVLGGGAGAAPIVIGSLGTTTTVLHGNAGGAPTFGAVSLSADVTGTTAIANGGTGQTTASEASGIFTLGEDVVTAREDFLGGSNAQSNYGTIGNLGWGIENVGGAGTFDYIDSEANAWGIFRIASDNTSGHGCSLTLERGTGFSVAKRIPPLNATTGWKVRFRARLNSTAACSFYIGLADVWTATPESNSSIGWGYDSATDTKFMVSTSLTGTPTRTASTVNIDTSWHLFEIYCDVSGTISFTIDGGTPITIATNVPTAALKPAFQVVTNTTAAKSLDAEFWVLKATVTR